MKKLIAILLLMLPAFIASAQRATFKDNQSVYNGITYKVGDTITLAKGSQSDKSFAFISSGTRQTGLTDLDAGFANSQIIIERIFIQRKSVYMDARLVNKTINATGANKVLVDLEAAVDNHEIN